MTWLEELIARLLAQLREAVSESKAGFPYFIVSYENAPYWTVGQNRITNTSFGSEKRVQVDMPAWLWIGKVTSGNRGRLETQARSYIPLMLDYFNEYDRLDMISAAYPTAMAGIITEGDFLSVIRNALHQEGNEQFIVLECIFSVQLLLPTAAS